MALQISATCRNGPAHQAVNNMQPSSRERRSFPTSLSSIKSEFEKMCDEFGGPADIGATIEHRDLERYCNEYPLRSIQPVLIQFQADATSVRRHWPWAAFALTKPIHLRKTRA